MTDPLLSVLCPAYQASRFLPDMIRSMQSQTYKNWELIIVDDGSKDNTWGVVAAFGEQDPRIRVDRIAHGGHSVALNECIGRARGDLIGRQDADDWSLPSRFEQQIAELVAGQFDLVSCLMSRVRRNGRITRGRDVGGSGCVPYDFCTDAVTKGPATATIVARREVYDRVGLYDTEAPGHMMGSTDSDWLFRVLLVDDPPYRWGHVHDELYCYRDHPQQGTKTHAAVAQQDHEMFRAKYAPLILERLRKEGLVPCQK